MSNSLTTYLQLFRTIPLDDQDIIENIIEHRQYKEGELLLQEGAFAKEMFFIVKGILKIVTTNLNGIEVACFFLKEHQFCTILGSFKNQVAANEGIKTACHTEVIVLPRNKLFETYQKLPYLQGLIDQITQQALLDKIQIRNNYMGLDAGKRYKMFMMRQPDIALRVPMRDIASYLGITPQSLSRIRKTTR